jgi:hypothetical protein
MNTPTAAVEGTAIPEAKRLPLPGWRDLVFPVDFSGPAARKGGRLCSEKGSWS